MFAAGFRSLALVAAVLCPALSAATSDAYQDPQGAFSIPFPPGWQVRTTSIHAVGVASGNAYTILFYVDDPAAHPELLDHYKNAACDSAMPQGPVRAKRRSVAMRHSGPLFRCTW